MGDRSKSTAGSQRDLPVEMYISLVDALYSDVRTFSFGIATASGAAAFSAYIADDWLLALCAIGIAVVGIARTIHILLYRRRRVKIVTLEAARRWELAYTTGANIYVLLLGLWCFVAFGLTHSDAAQTLSLMVALGNIVGILGRNFANARFFDIQYLCLGGPLISGLLLNGQPQHFVLAALIVIVLLSAKRYAARFRDMLVDAVQAQRDVSLIASRFDTALNNMPHGLAMFDAKGRLVVINQRWTEILPSDPEEVQVGGRAEAIVASYAASGLVSEADATRILERVRRSIADMVVTKLEIATDDRHVDITFQPMENRGLVVMVDDITEKRRTEARMAHMARHDALTGLPNRTLFQERLEVALAQCGENDTLAVLFVDLDNFKQVNDTLGLPVGDALLIEVADRLRFVIGEQDVVARFGADEFVVLQKGARSVNEVTSLAGRIIENLTDIIQIEGSAVVCGASVGIALAPRDGRDPDQLLKSADMALYRAKAAGKGILRFYEDEMDRQARARREIEMDLRKAIQNDELAVFFQPLLNLKSLAITTCEALVRWPHPVRGMVSPGEFIPVAEETGLVVELGRQVLRKACAACAAWPAGVRVSVNLSPVQFDREDVVALVTDTLAATGLAPDRLELEITETVLMQNSVAILDVFERLRAIGVRIALDDFGTGYSSLSYLHRFPLHKVKIDRSFVRSIETDARSIKLLHGVARLGAELGLSVVVEGVETQGQLDLIDAAGVVTEVQGFVLSPAVPDAQVRSLIGRSGKSLLRKVA